MKNRRTNKNCQYCGEVMINVPNGRKYCSKKCKFYSIGYTINSNGCHIWNGNKSSQKSKGGILFDYGSFLFLSKHYSAHVFSCELSNGPKPYTKAQVCHSCDTPSCINPKHLRWASAKENAADRENRGRHSHKGLYDGEAPRAKYNDAMYRQMDIELMRWIDEGKPHRTGPKHIAKKLGCTVSSITARKRYRFKDDIYTGKFAL